MLILFHFTVKMFFAWMNGWMDGVLVVVDKNNDDDDDAIEMEHMPFFSMKK